MRTVRDIGDELYALAPADFTAARDRFVAEAKGGGARELADEIAAMRRPSVSAWLVNLVALRAREDLERLFELGAAIRAAQGSVPPAQLRDLSAQRRRALDAAVARAQALAAGLGAAPSRQHVTEAESTLSAAMADDTVADLVRSGRVVKPLTYSGFGQEGVGGSGTLPRVSTARARSGPAGPERVGPGAAPAGTAEADRERAATQRRAAAEAKLDQARTAHADAAAIERESNALTERLAAEINDLRERLEQAQREARLARQRRMAAERELASARRLLDRLE